MLQVEVKLYGLLRDYRLAADGLPHHPFTVELPAHVTGADLVRHLALPNDLVAGISINNTAADLQTILQTGDRVSLFPPNAGGAR